MKVFKKLSDLRYQRAIRAILSGEALLINGAGKKFDSKCTCRIMLYFRIHIETSISNHEKIAIFSTL